MELNAILKIIEELKVKGELPYLEVKESLRDKDQIGKTLSALSNSASYHNKEFAYLIWGIQDKTWDIVGTTFNIETETQGRSGFIYPQIIGSFGYAPEILTGEFLINEKRIYVVGIKNCGNQPLSFDKICYIRVGEVNDELNDHTTIWKNIMNKNVDWSVLVPENSSLDLIDTQALEHLKEIYFGLEENKNKKLDYLQFLNALSLLDENNLPNNTCLLFIGKQDLVSKIYKDKNKITWIYKDEKNNIEERLKVEEENLPFIFGIQNVLDRINTRNSTLQDINLFTRNDVAQYDLKVIEEIIINAVAHRDWNINLWIEVVQTPASLEVRNPGKFRANLDKVLLENQRPEYLNPNLADFLKKVHLMEKEGGGLKKAYSTQIKKGLSIKLKFDNEGQTPRVDFVLSGIVKDVDFARFIFATKSLTQDQVVILDKINSGKNLFGKDINQEEYLLVENFISKTGQGGISLKIKEHLLKKSKKYINDFSNTHTSTVTSKEIILDYAKKNDNFTTSEIYDVLSGKAKPWVRSCLSQMVNDGQLQREKMGLYKLATTLQTKQDNGLKATNSL